MNQAARGPEDRVQKDAPMRIRLPRFGLKTLLAIVVISAVLCRPLKFLYDAWIWWPYRSLLLQAEELTDEEFVGLCGGMNSENPAKAGHAAFVVFILATGNANGLRAVGSTPRPYFPPNAAKALPALLKASNASDPRVQHAAEYAISKIGKSAAIANPEMDERLEDPD